jgi:hypothetical protein
MIEKRRYELLRIVRTKKTREQIFPHTQLLQETISVDYYIRYIATDTTFVLSITDKIENAQLFIVDFMTGEERQIYDPSLRKILIEFIGGVIHDKETPDKEVKK